MGKLIYKVRTIRKSPTKTRYVAFAHVEGNPQHVPWAGPERVSAEVAKADASEAKKRYGTEWPPSKR